MVNVLLILTVLGRKYTSPQVGHGMERPWEALTSLWDSTRDSPSQVCNTLPQSGLEVIFSLKSSQNQSVRQWDSRDPSGYGEELGWGVLAWADHMFGRLVNSGRGSKPTHGVVHGSVYTRFTSSPCWQVQVSHIREGGQALCHRWMTTWNEQHWRRPQWPELYSNSKRILRNIRLQQHCLKTQCGTICCVLWPLQKALCVMEAVHDHDMFFQPMLEIPMS